MANIIPGRDTIARAAAEGHRKWVSGPYDDAKGLHEYIADAVLVALVGRTEAEIRERIAQEIEALPLTAPTTLRFQAARVARGDA